MSDFPPTTAQMQDVLKRPFNVALQHLQVEDPFSWRHLGERELARYMLLWVWCSSPFLSREPVGEASPKLWTRG